MSDVASVWDELTPIQSDAIHATAAEIGTDAEELALALVDLLRDPPAEPDTSPAVLLGTPVTDTSPLPIINIGMMHETAVETVEIRIPKEQK